MVRTVVVLLIAASALVPAYGEFSSFTFLAPRFNFRILGGPPVPTGAGMPWPCLCVWAPDTRTASWYGIPPAGTPSRRRKASTIRRGSTPRTPNGTSAWCWG